MVDISSYAAKIHDRQDAPLFDDAVKSAKAGAARSAYVMLWLACAESLKRKFRDASKRDGAAGKVVGEVKKKEEDQKSVDKFLLEKAKEYGFVSDPAFKILTHIYELRCVYGHPYEQAPGAEQITHAAAMVTEHVLSQPVKLRQGYCSQLIKSLMEDKHFLDNQDEAVKTFAGEILPKIDESVYAYLLDAYWTKLEAIADDPSLRRFFTRGMWFTRAFLTQADDVFTPDEWHAKAGVYPKTLVRVLSRDGLFEKVGERAQDTLVGAALDQSVKRSRMLQYIELLMEAGQLSDRQKSRFLARIRKMPLERLKSSKLTTKTILPTLIEELKSHNWYQQKPAVELMVGNGAAKIADLDVIDQVTLGRNILQVADGSERSARKLLRDIADEPKGWPVAFLRGVFIECFVNETKQVRMKCDLLKLVLRIVDGLDPTDRDQIVQKTRSAIAGGKPKGAFLPQAEFDRHCESLGAYAWAAPVTEALKAMPEGFVTKRDDEDE